MFLTYISLHILARFADVRSRVDALVGGELPVDDDIGIVGVPRLQHKALEGRPLHRRTDHQVNLLRAEGLVEDLGGVDGEGAAHRRLRRLRAVLRRQRQTGAEGGAGASALDLVVVVTAEKEECTKGK